MSCISKNETEYFHFNYAKDCDHPKHKCNSQSVFVGGCGNKLMKSEHVVQSALLRAPGDWLVTRELPIFSVTDSSSGQRPHNSLAESFAEKFLDA